MKKLITAILAIIAISGCKTTTTKPTITKDDLKYVATIITDYKQAQADIEKAKAEQKQSAMSQAYSGATTTQTTQSTPAKPEDYEKMCALKWNDVADETKICECYFGYGHSDDMFTHVAELPIDFTCNFSFSGGVSISKPASDDTGCMASYPGDHMQGRRAFVCVFDSNGTLIECEDWAQSYNLDNRFMKSGVTQGFVVHCKQGKAVSRTALTRVS